MTDAELHSQAHLYVVGALDPDEVRTFEAHVAGCADCQKEVAAMNEVTAHLSEIVAADPPVALRSSVLAQIAGTAQDPAAAVPQQAPGRGRHAAPVSATTHAPARAAEASDTNVVALRRPWRERTAILVAAAAVLAAIGVGGWALNDRNNARDELTAAQQEIATAQQINDDIASVLSSGDAQSVSAKTKSGATTVVVRSPSRGVALLLASGLPSLPAGKTYQAWTIDNDKATSAGTFESQGDHTAYELPPAAVDTGTVAITVEPAGGSDQPSTTPIVALGLG
jgi:anti-sigma-K factor RskA